MRELTYKYALRMILRGFICLFVLLSRTFTRQTKALFVNHPLYLFLFFAIFATQVIIIGKERAHRDADSATIYHLQHQIDSITNKHTSYIHY